MTSTFPPYMGGIGNVAYNIALHLHRRGHQVTVFTPRYGKVDYRQFPFHVKAIRPLLIIGNACFVPRFLKEIRDLDIIHLHYPFFGGDIFVFIAALWRRIPYVVTYHQDADAEGALKKSIIWLYRLLFERLIIKKARHIFGLSMDHLIHSRIRYITKDSSRYTIVGNGINLPGIQPALSSDALNIRKLFDASDDFFIIGFVGGLDRAHYFKNVPFLIRAMSRMPETTGLVIIGEGDMRISFEKLSQQLGLTKKIKFLGNIDNSKIYSVISQLSCLVLPSTEVESFGIVLLEAMACGVPVVASNIPGVRSVVQDGVTGFLFTPGATEEYISAIMKLRNNPIMRANMGQAGERAVRRDYIWDTVVNKIEGTYQRVVRQCATLKSQDTMAGHS